MFIKNLHLTNFKSIEDEYFDFENKRLIGVAGRNGSGKSSMLQSIEIMLLGKSKTANLEDFAGNLSDSYSIESEFSHEGIDYKFEATYSGGMKRTLIFGNEKLKNSAVTTYLATIIDPKLALYSSFSFQGDATAILSQDNAERLEYMKKILLNEDILKEKDKKVVEQLSIVEEDIIGIEKEIEILDKNQYTYEDELLFNDNRDLLKKQIEDINREKGEYKSILSKYEDDLKKYLEDDSIYQKEFTSYQDLLSEYHKQVSEIDSDYNRLYEMFSAYETKQIEYSNYAKNKERYDEEIISLTKEISEYKVVNDKKRDHTDNDISNLEESIIEYRTNLNKIRSDISLAKQGKCPTCGKDFEGKSVSEYEKMEKDINDKIGATNENIISWKEERRVFENAEREVRNNIIQRDKLQDRLSNLKAPEEIPQPRPVRKPMRRDYPETPSFTLVKPQMPNKPEDKSFDAEIFEIEKRIIDIDAKIKQNEDIKKRNSKIKEKEDLVVLQKEGKSKDREKLIVKQDNLKKALKILRKDLPVFVIDKGISHIRRQTNKFFKDVYDRYSVDIIPHQNSIAIFYHDEDKVRNANLASGAEKQIISMAFRVALCSLQDTGLFIIDEADSEADDDRSLELIENLSKRDFEQMIVITHKNPTKSLLEELPGSKVFFMEDSKIC